MEDTQTTSGTRKCPNCGQWSEWNFHPDDRCTHCGHLLDPQAFASRQKEQERKANEKHRFRLDLIEIDPNEPFYLRGPKHVIRAVQVSFVALVSFIIWLIVAVAS